MLDCYCQAGKTRFYKLIVVSYWFRLLYKIWFFCFFRELSVTDSGILYEN